MKNPFQLCDNLDIDLGGIDIISKVLEGNWARPAFSGKDNEGKKWYSKRGTHTEPDHVGNVNKKHKFHENLRSTT